MRWAAAEREAWLEAVTNHSLLPGRILPSDYLGQQAWRRRVEVLRDAGRQPRTFNPEKPAQPAPDAEQVYVAYAT